MKKPFTPNLTATLDQEHARARDLLDRTLEDLPALVPAESGPAEQFAILRTSLAHLPGKAAANLAAAALLRLAEDDR